MADRPTLLRPPPDDPNKAQIENALEVAELAVLGPVSYSSLHDLHLPLHAHVSFIASFCSVQHSRDAGPF